VVFPYAYDNVARFEIESAAARSRSSATGSTGTSPRPKGSRRTPAPSTSSSGTSAIFRASGFLDESPAGVPRYLSKPEVTCEDLEEGAKEPKTLLLGCPRGIKAGELTGVRARAEGPVFMVEPKDIQPFQDGDRLRDKTVGSLPST